MKKLFALTLIPLLFFACSKPGANSTLEKQMTSGTWTIDSYMENGSNETVLFLGMVFSFENAGDIVINDGGFLLEGSWVRTNTSTVLPSMNLNFGSNATLNKLNGEWEATFREQNTVQFEPVGNANKVLIFER